jgi:UDP-N-acetyl-D-glucosamine/UDP-N-acetyl-D-galactosamine dehydrogenase
MNSLSQKIEDKTITVAIIGMGYVGLPLAVEFSKHFQTIGFDINQARIDELKAGNDKTLEVDQQELAGSKNLVFSTQAAAMGKADVYIVTVPTPIDNQKQPDLTPLQKASETIGAILKDGNVVIYESTVYPGATEEVCVPILERISNLTFNKGFTAGYSPERINPGDKEHRLPNIQKITAGSTAEAADVVDMLYQTIITAGTCKVSSIKIAEAAKVIENTQRDVNIALINELAILFNKLGLDTEEVLQAAGTKWNFLPFRPGLVGGHCIGVDPYYLTHKAREVGYHPEIILAGRRLNDGMGAYIVEQVARLMSEKRIHVVDAKVLVMGLTFKENCPDIRNTRVINIIEELKNRHAKVDVYDPWIDPAVATKEYDINVVEAPEPGSYDAVVLAVPHLLFKEQGLEAIRSFGKAEHVLFDVKYLFQPGETDGRL